MAHLFIFLESLFKFALSECPLLTLHRSLGRTKAFFSISVFRKSSLVYSHLLHKLSALHPLRPVRRLEALWWVRGASLSCRYYCLFLPPFSPDPPSWTAGLEGLGEKKGQTSKERDKILLSLSGAAHIFLVNSDSGSTKRCHFPVFQRPQLLILT